MLISGETVVVKETFNNYDLYLVKTKSGYKFIVFMKVQFFFEDGGKSKWKPAEKTKFVSDWKSVIQGKWNKPGFKSLKSGSIPLEFRFQTQIGGWMWDHWELTVKKIPKGQFSGSSVTDSFINNSALDSEDFALTAKGNSQKQRGAVHEFGHMLGLDDEYKKSHAKSKDYRSIMNSGEYVYPRHRAVFLTWLEKQLKSQSIK